MIRTDTVELTVIPAVAFRQKLPSGGSGVTVLRYDAEQPGIASISKSSGKAIRAKNTPKDLYPSEAFNEAIELTRGMPYRKRGGVRLSEKKVIDTEPEVAAEVPEVEVILDSADYQRIVRNYTDKNGKLSYILLNRDLINLAHRSSKVRTMLAEGAKLDSIRDYIVLTRFISVTENHNLSQEQAAKAAELLDEVSPQSVFKTLNEELKKMASAQKKK